MRKTQTQSKSGRTEDPIFYFSRATTKDIPAILTMYRALSDHHQELDPMWLNGTEAVKSFKKYLSTTLPKRDFYWLIIKHKERPIGFFGGNVSQKGLYGTIFKKGGYICDGYIDPKHRGLGLARMALDIYKKWFKSQKVKFLELAVVSKNKIGVQAWEKLGFKEYTKKLYQII